MPQMSNLDWMFLSFYFFILYWMSLMLMNFLNFGINFFMKDFFSNILVLKFNLNWK